MRGEGRGHRLVAQHVEQRLVIPAQRHALDREVGAGFGIGFAPFRHISRRAALKLQRANLPADRIEVEEGRHGFILSRGMAARRSFGGQREVHAHRHHSGIGSRHHRRRRLFRLHRHGRRRDHAGIHCPHLRHVAALAAVVDREHTVDA